MIAVVDQPLQLQSLDRFDIRAAINNLTCSKNNLTNKLLMTLLSITIVLFDRLLRIGKWRKIIKQGIICSLLTIAKTLAKTQEWY